MTQFRAYLNKAKGNEHSRVVDFEAADDQVARGAAENAAKKGEVVGEIVVLNPGGQVFDSRFEALVASIGTELAQRMGVTPEEAQVLAREAALKSGPLLP